MGNMEPAHVANVECQRGMRDVREGSVALVLADPPYNISVGGAPWDTIKDYMSFARSWLYEAVRVLRPGGALLLFGSPCETWMARMSLLLVDELGMRHVQDMPWIYRQGGDTRWETMTKYAVRHERLVWFEKPRGERTFNAEAVAEPYTAEERVVALAKGKGRVKANSLDKGRPPRSFIDIPRENSRSKERSYGKHPCMKPLALCERLIAAHTNRGDIVVVPFAGSGSEMLSASKLGRVVHGFETEEQYVALMQTPEPRGARLGPSGVLRVLRALAGMWQQLPPAPHLPPRCARPLSHALPRWGEAARPQLLRAFVHFVALPP